jgi:hypothetical protein
VQVSIGDDLCTVFEIGVVPQLELEDRVEDVVQSQRDK